MLVPIPNQELDFLRQMSWYFLFVFNELRWEVIVRLVDIGGFIGHHCLISVFIILWFCDISSLPIVISTCLIQWMLLKISTWFLISLKIHLCIVGFKSNVGLIRFDYLVKTLWITCSKKKKRLFNNLAFQYYDCEHTWRNLFQKRAWCTKLDIYVFIGCSGKCRTLYKITHPADTCSKIHHMTPWLSKILIKVQEKKTNYCCHRSFTLDNWFLYAMDIIRSKSFFLGGNLTF